MTSFELSVADEPLGPVRRIVATAAARVGCTEGQVQTLAIGVVLAVITAAVGLPPVFEDRATPQEIAYPTVEPPTEVPPTRDTVPVVSGTPGLGGIAGNGSTSPGGSPATPPPDVMAPPVPGASQPRFGVPGSNGRCGMRVRSIDNPRHADGETPMPVWIYEPTGGAPASIAGGPCSGSSRPTVFFAHGFGQTDPAAYADLIEHFVSVGNIVVYPTYDVDDGERRTLEESHRVVDAGFVAAVAETNRIDTTRVGWWGHSHGGGMVPYLVQRGAARGWGADALWLSIVAQAYTQLVGADDIPVPTHAQQMTVAFQHDAMADARLGIDVFESLLLPGAQKRHVTVQSGLSDDGAFSADHGAPQGIRGQADDVDRLLWRYADLLELCALHGRGCRVDLSRLDGVRRAVVSDAPVDVGPYPALLAECDAVYGPTLNPRIERCGETRI